MGLVQAVGDKVLSSPLMFDTFQWLIGAPRSHRYWLREYVQVRPGERVLDIGCGVGAILEHLPDGVEYVGIDISGKYIAKAQERWGRRGQFICADVLSVDKRRFGQFDRAFSYGVLHHVDDEIANGFFGLAQAATGSGGRFVTIDPYFADKMNPVARYIIKQDRGRHVRTIDQYVNLASKHGTVDPIIAKNFTNIPYAQLVLRVTFP